jgi:small-conductance mechanosensitive channel
MRQQSAARRFGERTFLAEQEMRETIVADRVGRQRGIAAVAQRGDAEDDVFLSDRAERGSLERRRETLAEQVELRRHQARQLGGTRDVVRVGFMQTSVMEMGAPAASQDGTTDTWVSARQYTGRLVSVTNDKIFDNPVFNYTREFPFMWDEMRFPIKYGADYQRAESILLAAARHQTGEYVEKATPALERLRERFVLALEIVLEPRVYLHLTDNWIELTLRFLVPVHGVRAIKDAMGREILAGLQEAHLEIASGTYEIVGLPPIRVEQNTSDK